MRSRRVLVGLALSGVVVAGLGLAYGSRWRQARTWRATTPQQVFDAQTSQEAERVNSQPLPVPLKKPRLVVYKSLRKLELYDGEQLLRVRRVGLGFAPEGTKDKQGDGKTPEGDYYIHVKNPKSQFYLSLGVSYPNPDDAERGVRAGLITGKQRDQIMTANANRTTPPQSTKLGGLIYIHGGGSGEDWTWGCVALENAEIKELFDALDKGTPVTIKP